MTYLLNVPWGWIKQRPQYLAEALGKYYDVNAYEKMAYCRHTHVINTCDGINLNSLKRLPFDRIPAIGAFNGWLYHWQLFKRLHNATDVLWVCDANYPEDLGRILPKRSLLVYDCMDDMVAFPHMQTSTKRCQVFMRRERKLIEAADVVFVSANNLREVLLDRYHGVDANKMYVLNNAVSRNLLERYKYKLPTRESNTAKVITYIGTISEWMDWPLILDSLKYFSQIEYHFYGPAEVSLPQHDRIIYKGILPQVDIAKAMCKADLLVMPFKVTDLIKSVNPVKLYEYILSGIPAVACEYPESSKFGEYVHLYNNEQAYMQLLQRLIDGTLPRKRDDGRQFVTQNTWENRAAFVYETLEKIRYKK